MTTSQLHSFDDLQLLEVATHDLLTATQMVMNHLDLVALVDKSPATQTLEGSAREALDRLLATVRAYRSRTIGHDEYATRVVDRATPVAVAAHALAAHLQGRPPQRAVHPEKISGVASHLAWIGRASAYVVSGLDDGHREVIGRSDVGRVLQSVVELHREAAEAKGLRLSVAPALPPNWPALPEWVLRTITGNLVANAIKYTDAGSVEVGTSLDAHGAAVIAVSDTGIGMDADTLRSISSPGHRAEQVVAEGREGRGYGLALSAWAARFVGAQLTFTSALGKGTCASVVFAQSAPTLH